MQTQLQNITPPPATFTRYKIVHTCIHESESGYIYRCDDPDGYTYYEVFKKILSNKIKMVDGKHVAIQDELKYMYPKDAAFGRWAWTTPVLSRAHQLLDRLNTIA